MKFLFSTSCRGRGRPNEKWNSVSCAFLLGTSSQMAKLVMAKCLWALWYDLPKDDQTRKKLKLNGQSDKQDSNELLPNQNMLICVAKAISVLEDDLFAVWLVSLSQEQHLGQCRTVAAMVLFLFVLETLRESKWWNTALLRDVCGSLPEISLASLTPVPPFRQNGHTSPYFLHSPKNTAESRTDDCSRDSK